MFDQTTAPPAFPAATPPVPQTPPATPQVTMPAEPAAAPNTTVAEELPENWPILGYDGPQPWQVSRPPAVCHDRGILIAGSHGDAVLELAACLARLGYQTSITRGENVNAVFGAAEAAAVASFRRDYGVQEDPAIIAASTEGAVGPWTWEALFRRVRQVEDLES